jgi:hypothetical protein
MSTPSIQHATMVTPSTQNLTSSEIVEPTSDHSDKSEEAASIEHRIFKEHSPTQSPRENSTILWSSESTVCNSTVEYHDYLRSINQPFPATYDPTKVAIADSSSPLPHDMTPSNLTQEVESAFDPGEMRNEVLPQELPNRPVPKGKLFARLFKRLPERSEDIELGRRRSHRQHIRENRQFCDEIPTRWVVSSLIFFFVLALLAWGMVLVDRSADSIQMMAERSEGMWRALGFLVPRWKGKRVL